jgi:hypothetical protein
MTLWKRITLAIILTVIATWATWNLFTFGCYFMACFLTAPLAFGVSPIAAVMIIKLFLKFDNQKWFYLIYFVTIIVVLIGLALKLK